MACSWVPPPTPLFPDGRRERPNGCTAGCGPAGPQPSRALRPGRFPLNQPSGFPPFVCASRVGGQQKQTSFWSGAMPLATGGGTSVGRGSPARGHPSGTDFQAAALGAHRTLRVSRGRLRLVPSYMGGARSVWAVTRLPPTARLLGAKRRWVRPARWFRRTRLGRYSMPPPVSDVACTGWFPKDFGWV